MELTFIGIIQVVIGIYVVFAGSVRASIMFLVISAMFDGSAAISLTDLGGSSIPPVQFALLFTGLRILAPKGGYLGWLPAAISDNKWIVFFVAYGIVSAYLGPRMFGGMIDVFPMRPGPSMGPFDTVPLEPTSQNLTASFYLLGALLLAISSYIFCRIPAGANALVVALLLASWFHISTGVLDLLTRGTMLEAYLTFFRNAGYTPLDLSISGFIRIRGVLTEASGYASLGFALFLVNAELWYRSIRARATGLAAAALAFLLVLSTASTAYVALGAYAVFFIFRGMVFSNTAPSGKFVRAAIAAFGILFILSILMVSVPRLPFAVYELIVEMTVDKPTSFSGQQRLFWALQGWHSFIASFGLGVGAGSFRSSSMITAILGSMGLVGVATFALYLKSVFQASKRSTWGLGPDLYRSVGGALGTAAVLSLLPAAVSSPHAFPGALFSIMAGSAIALRKGFATAPETSANPVGNFRWEKSTDVEEVSTP
jgi:hypothetical protein